MCQSVSERLEALTPRLRLIAASIARMSYSHTPDDLYQTMALSILERAAKDPAFIRQNDAYICCFAGWMAKHAAESDRARARFYQELEEEMDFVYLGVQEPGPETAYLTREAVQAIVDAARSRSPRQQQIVQMLYAGYRNSEIAAALGVSRPAVTQAINQLAACLPS